VLIWSRAGSYTNIYYRSTQIDMSSIEPIGDQLYIVEDIVNKYRARQRLVVFVHGVTGAGKSTLGLFVAKQLSGLYCHTFNPSEPGDTFENLLRDTETMDEDEKKPLIVVIEEANEMIKAAHTNEVTLHKNVTTQVKSKGTFNTFLDNMMFHNKVILILTSNQSKEEIDTLCPSYLRRGRVNAYYSMMNSLEVIDL
jgi:Cdc6-like AAA superfamily ATPase